MESLAMPSSGRLGMRKVLNLHLPFETACHLLQVDKFIQIFTHKIAAVKTEMAISFHARSKPTISYFYNLC